MRTTSFKLNNTQVVCLHLFPLVMLISFASLFYTIFRVLSLALHPTLSSKKMTFSSQRICFDSRILLKLVYLLVALLFILCWVMGYEE